MTSLSKTRIESLDLLKGLVMVIMAIDHTRDYFHYSAFFFDPTDIPHTTWPIFLTRFITNFCAPAFSFLAGISAFMIGKRKSTTELSMFLMKRGLWLVFVEIIVVSFGWKADLQFRDISLQTIWAIGISMIVLAGLIHLPKKFILLFSCILIFGHNLLDSVHFNGSILWAILHERTRFEWAADHFFLANYSLLPWVAVLSLGYCFGSLYHSSILPSERKKILNNIGIVCFALFVGSILLNKYGNLEPWKNYGDTSKTLMSMLNITKYPPSLRYLLFTLGGTFIFLANSENLKGSVVNFFTVFGRVPFFYYIMHIYLIHALAICAGKLSGFSWQLAVLHRGVNRVEALKGYGFSLIIVYMVWVFVIVVLYPICKKFDSYKQAHKEKWWLSYL